MFVHPEMKETMTEAMREGLAHWRDKSPDDIAARLRVRTQIDQRVLLDRKQDIGYEVEFTCDCPTDSWGFKYHWPMCDKPTRVKFVSLQRQIDKPYKPWIYGRSLPYSIGRNEDINAEK